MSNIWDEITPVAIMPEEHYFFDKQQLIEYCDSNDIDIRELKLYLCEPNYLQQINYNEYYYDDIPDGCDELNISTQLANAFKLLNDEIKKHPPISWSPTNKAVIVALD